MNYENEFDDDNEEEFSNDAEVSDDVVDENEEQEDIGEENKNEKVNLKHNDFKILTFENVIEEINKKPKRTIPFLTKFEKARIMGVRLQQLAYGAKPRIKTEGLTSIQEIVQQELIQRKIPFIIRRTLPNNTFEDWRMEEFRVV
jgi:DNA-directed RNA polymerase I, II, and III subunit RPABC2